MLSRILVNLLLLLVPKTFSPPTTDFCLFREMVKSIFMFILFQVKWTIVALVFFNCTLKISLQLSSKIFHCNFGFCVCLRQILEANARKERTFSMAPKSNVKKLESKKNVCTENANVFLPFASTFVFLSNRREKYYDA